MDNPVHIFYRFWLRLGSRIGHVFFFFLLVCSQACPIEVFRGIAFSSVFRPLVIIMLFGDIDMLVYRDYFRILCLALGLCLFEFLNGS